MGDIFRAQLMMLNDSGLQRALFTALESSGETAESAVATSLWPTWRRWPPHRENRWRSAEKLPAIRG
jgi:hypothetical protein